MIYSLSKRRTKLGLEAVGKRHEHDVFTRGTKREGASLQEIFSKKLSVPRKYIVLVGLFLMMISCICSSKE